MSSANQPLTIREVLHLIWEADRYPCPRNGDIQIADLLEEEALAKARDAIHQPPRDSRFQKFFIVLRRLVHGTDLGRPLLKVDLGCLPLPHAKVL